METIKFITELITSIVTASVEIINLSKFIPTTAKKVFTETIPLFFVMELIFLETFEGVL
jgi:hypothetical protein